MENDRRKRGTDRWITAGMLAVAAFSLTCVLAAAVWTHHGWHQSDPRFWQLAAPSLLALLSVLPLVVFAQIQARRLRRSETRFGRFFERTSDPILLLDPRGSRVVDANTCAVELFGQPREKILSKSLPDLFAEEPETIKAFLGRVRSQGSTWHEQLRCSTGSGLVVHAEATATVSPDDDSLVLARLRNVDEHQRMERAVYSLAQLSSGLEDVDFYQACVRDLANTYRCRWAFTGVFTDREKHSITTLAFWDETGLRDNITYRLAGTPCADVFAGSLSQVSEGVTQRYGDNELLRDLPAESYMATPLVDRAGDPIGIVAILDVDPLHGGRSSETLINVYANRLAVELQRREAQLKLLDSEKNFRRLAEGSIEGIVIHRDFKLLYMNPSFAGMLGYAPDELFALPNMEELFAERALAQVHEIATACLHGDNAPSVCTTEMRHRDGRPVEVQMRTTRTQWDGEDAVQTTMIDITEQREAEWILHSLHEFSAQQDLGFESRTRALLGAGCLYFDLPNGTLSHIRDQTFEVLSAVTPDDSLQSGDRFSLVDTFCGEIAGQREAAVYTDVLESGLGEHPCYEKFGFRTYVGIPLHVRGSFFGTLAFSGPAPREREFTRSEVRILELMGRWVASEIARRLDERDRVESEQRFRDFAETSADWFWESDQDMRFTLVHGKFEEVTGIDARQILGTTRDSLYERYVANTAELNASYQNAVQARKPFRELQSVWRRTDGELRILSNSGKPFFDASGEFVGYRGAGRDVTEQVLAQEAVKRSEERFRDFASTAADWFWETDDELRFVYISENHARITGLENSEFLGKSRLEAYRAPSPFGLVGQQHVDDMRERRRYATHLELRRPDGGLLIVYEQGKPLFDEDGRFVGYRGIGRDITDRVLTQRELEKHQHSLQELVAERTQELEAAQKELLQQERLATIGRLVATVSHELRNPLGAVRNAAYYLQRKAPRNEPRWLQQLEIIEKEINSADKIISDLLETTRAKVPVIQDIDLESLVKQVFENCRGERKIDFRYSGEPDGLRLLADKDHLRQVLLNLVTNSVHALQNGGSILVSAKQEPTCNVIYVRDDGPGIPHEHREQIFEPLFTTKSKGNGLGLWISKEIVERHGGSLALMRDTRRGTSFEIVLPHDREPSALAATG